MRAQGGFAKCYKFTELSRNRVVAGKVVAKSSLTKSRAKQKLLAEIRIHRALSHPSVVRFESFFEDDNNVYIILELCGNRVRFLLFVCVFVCLFVCCRGSVAHDSFSFCLTFPLLPPSHLRP